MKTLFFFVFCTFSVLVQAEPKVIIFYEYTADGYALFAANEEEYPVTIEFNFDLLNLKVVRDGPSSIVVPAEAKKHKLVDLVAINVLKGYSFEYTFTAKKGAVKANLEDIIAVSDRAAIKAKELSKNVDTTDDPVLSVANRNPRDLRERRIGRKSSRLETETEAETKPITIADVKLDSNNKPIAKTEPTQVAIAKAVKKKEREKAEEEKKRLAKKTPVAVIKTEPAKTGVASTTVEVKEPTKKDVVPVTKTAPITKSKPDLVADPADALVKTEPAKTGVASTTVEVKEPTKKDIVLVTKTEPIAKTKPDLVAEPADALVKTEPIKTEPVKAVVASKAIETNDTAKKGETLVKTEPITETKAEVAIAEPVKKERTKKKKSKRKPVVLATPPIVTSKPVETITPIAIPKPETTKPAVVITTSKEKPAAEIMVPKKEEKTKPTYAVTGKYDAAFQYHLPYSKDAVFIVSQGYQGSLSHQNKFALDFRMPSGTTIYSAREGTVLEVVENNSQGCATQDCEKYDNYIIINHPDGSFAKYAHIKTDGALVAAGDVITIGQLIGYTGNTGWTATPALHFEVFVQKEKEQKTIKTNFLTGDGSDYGILTEQRRYKKEY